MIRLSVFSERGGFTRNNILLKKYIRLAISKTATYSSVVVKQESCAD